MSFKFASWVRALMKGMGHRYIKRIPYMTPKGRRYRYIYRVDHTHRGKHAFHEDHLVTGTKFALSTEDGAEFHGHIESVDGDKVKYMIDDGPQKGAVVETTKQELAAKLNEVHGVSDKLADARDKASADLEQVKQSGGSEKQIARARRRLLALGGTEDKETTREGTQGADNFETMPEVESVEDLRAEFKRKIEAYEGDDRLYVELFDAANYSETLANVPDSELFEHPITQELFSLTVGYPKDPVYIRGALKKLPPEYTKRLYTELLRRYRETGQSSISEGAAVGILQAYQHHFEQPTAPTAPPPIEEKEHPLLGLKTLDLDPQQVRSSYRNISHTAEKRAESERREWAETLDQLEAQAESEIQAGAKREEVEKRYQKLARRLLRTKQNVISARAQTASSAITGAGQFNARQAQKRQQTLERREAEYRQALRKIKDTQPPTQTTPREETRGADAPEIAQEPQRFSDINREYQRRLAAARDKARENLERVKRRGGTKKQIAQARRKLRALGGTETVDTRAPDSEDPKPTAQSASPSGVTDSSGQLMSKRTLQEIVANIVETESKTKRLNIADLHGALYQRGVSIRPGQLKDLLSAASSRNIISLKPWTEGLDKVDYPEYLISRLQGNMMYHVEPANGPKRDLPDTPATVRLNGRPLSLAEVSQEVVRKLGSNATSIKDLEAGLRESGMDIETGHLHDHLNLLNEKGIVAFEEDRMHTRNPDATSSLVRRDEQGITRVYDKVRLAQ